MPLVPLTSLPDESRVWVFGSPRPLEAETEETFLATVDRYLDGWKAHGAPLTVGRDWSERQFLTVVVDSSQTHASGCSIDGLFRELKALEAAIGTSLLGSGTIYYKDRAGVVQAVDRGEWLELAARGEVDKDTPVYDFMVQTLGAWRSSFRTVAGRSWHGALLPVLR